MLDDNNDGLDRRRNLNEREGMGRMMVLALAALAVLAVMFLWAPWKDTTTADNTSPGTTVGSSTTRPAAPAAPTAPAPAAPAPSTTR